MEHKLDNKIKKEKKILELKKEVLESKKEEIEEIRKEIKEEKKIVKTEERIIANKKASNKIFSTIKENSIVSYFDKFLSQKNHKLIVPIAGFFDTIFMVIPIDVITVAYVIRHRKDLKLIPFSLVASFFTALGTSVVYFMGYFFSDQITTFLSSVSAFLHLPMSAESYSGIAETISKHQLILTFIASATSTVPFAVLAFFAGGFKFNILYFLIAIFFGRFLKFMFISYLTKYYGPAALKKASKNIIPFIIIILLILAVKIFFF